MTLKITNNEISELKYFLKKGFNYVAKNENNEVFVFKSKPNWYKDENKYGVWGIKEIDTSYFDRTQDDKVILGKFEWLDVTNPLLINDIIKDL